MGIEHNLGFMVLIWDFNTSLKIGRNTAVVQILSAPLCFASMAYWGFAGFGDVSC